MSTRSSVRLKKKRNAIGAQSANNDGEKSKKLTSQELTTTKDTSDAEASCSEDYSILLANDLSNRRDTKRIAKETVTKGKKKRLMTLKIETTTQLMRKPQKRTKIILQLRIA